MFWGIRVEEGFLSDKRGSEGGERRSDLGFIYFWKLYRYFLVLYVGCDI